MIPIVVLYYSRGGNTRRMANQIARGVEQIADCEAMVRTVPAIRAENAESPSPAPNADPAPWLTRAELQDSAALIVGSPTRFGNMAAPLKAFFDSTSDLWLAGAMVDKPGAVFTSSSSQHGGQESTLLTMMLPLLHHGMLMVGLPYTEPALSRTAAGGSPYGAGHVAGSQDANPLDRDEKALCIALGKRVATIASQLARP